MICAYEAWGILAYAEADLDPADDEPADLPSAVLSLVDRGWVQVHRLEPWTSPDGDEGATYSPPIAREDIPAILADPATWDDPKDPGWFGAVTLSVTDAWRQLNQQE